MKKSQLLIIVLFATLLLAACSGAPTPNVEATVQAALAATQTAQPTNTPPQIHTPPPTHTPLPPTATPTQTPTLTPTPRPPTATPANTPTPRPTSAPQKPTPVPTKTAETYLSQFQPTTIELGFGTYSVGEFKFNSDDPADDIHYGDPIVLHGIEYPHGIFAHAPSRLVYNLGSHRYEEFIATLGLVDKISCGDGVKFIILLDGKEIYRSEVLNPWSAPVDIQVPIADGSELTLSVDPGSQGDNRCDWGIWGDPRLLSPQQAQTAATPLPAKTTATPLPAVPPTPTAAPAAAPSGFDVPAGKALFVFYNYTDVDWDIDIGPHLLKVPANKPGQEYTLATLAIDPGKYTWQAHSPGGGWYITNAQGGKSFDFTITAGEVKVESVR